MMGKNSDISSEMVAQMVALRDVGMKQKVIAVRLHIHPSVVCRCLKRHSQTSSFSARKRTGRGRITTARTDALIRRIATITPSATSTFIKSQLPPEVKISTTTIKRRLHDEFDLKAYRPAAKPMLSTKNIRDRLAFCNHYKSWSVKDWQKVLFSDECMIKQFANYSQHVRRPTGKRYNPRFVVPTVKHSPSLMVWGCISAEGCGNLWFMPPSTTINAHAYLSILQEKLPLSMPRLHCKVFQQDGAPAHNSKLVKQWLASWLEDNGLRFLEGWPGNSPDLNVIENCWMMLKKKVADLNPTSLQDLEKKLNIVWTQHITPDYCAGLVKSMPLRIKAVLAAKGAHTKY